MSRSRKDGRHRGGHRKLIVKLINFKLRALLDRFRAKKEIRTAWDEMSDDEYNRLTNYGAF